MITFTCPKCDKALTAPDEAAGREGRCACGASFVIPWAEPPRPLPPPREVEYEPDADGEPEPYRPRRRRRSNAGRQGVLVGLVLLAVVASVWIGVRWSRTRGQAVDSAGNTVPGTEREPPVLLPAPLGPGDNGPDWTYREVLDYLRSRGLPVKMSPCRRGQFYMMTDSDYDVAAWASYADEGIVHAAGVVCVKTASARDAKAAADRHERGTLAWGRYCFTGSDEMLGLVRQALTGRGPITDGSPDLSYEDVLGRLRAKGVAVRMRPCRVNGIEGRLFVLTDSEDDAALAGRLFGGAPPPAGVDPMKARELLLRTVFCTKMRFAVQARGEVRNDSQTSSFAWGRFVFAAVKVEGEAGGALQQVRTALGRPEVKP